MMNENSIKTLPATQLVIFNSNIRIWSGTVKIERDQDLPALNDGKKLPPKRLVSDGRKTLVDSKLLNPLEGVRKSIERLLKQGGFSYAGTGIAVTEEHAAEVLKQLPALRQKFEEAIDELVSKLDEAYDAQESLYPEWAYMLCQSRLTETQVRNRCHFGLNVFRMSMPDPDNPDSPANDFFRDMAEQALPELLETVRKDASDLLRRVRGKANMNQAQLQAVQAMVKKLVGFAFLDPQVGPAAAALTSMLEHMPTSGPLNITSTTVCVSVVEMLASPNRLLAHGKSALDDHLKANKALSVQSELSIPEASGSVEEQSEPTPTAVVARPRMHVGI